MPYVASDMEDTTSEQRSRKIGSKGPAKAAPKMAAIIVIGAIVILGIEAGLLKRFL